MSAIHQWSESNGVTPTVTDGISNLNFGSVDSVNLVPNSNPIAVGTNSFHKAIRCKFTDTFTEISNMKFWESIAVYKTGEDIVGKYQSAYVQPVASSLAGASSVPVVEGSCWVIHGANGTDLTITVAGYTEYILLQLQTTVLTPSGAVNQKTFTFKYDEI
jgi:hypothetical protein